MMGHKKCFYGEIWLIGKFSLTYLGYPFLSVPLVPMNLKGWFSCPGHKMAEGHIVFTLSVCVCIFQIHDRPITSLCMVGFKNHLAQMIKTRQCVACKNHVARSKVMVTVGT